MDINQAFVLHSIDYRDSSKILYLYTKQGQKSIIAHGVKKLNSINRFLSQTGNEIKCIISDGSFPSLKDGELIEEYEYVKQDVLAYSYMTHILELVRHTVTEDSDHEKMYQFLQKIFRMMNQKTDPEILSFIFELKHLYFIGNGLHFQSCTSCDKTDNLVFHVSSGGLVCEEHLPDQQNTYDHSIYYLLQDLYYIDISNQELPEMDHNHRVIIRHILDLLYQEFVSFETKSRMILQQIKKY